MPPTSPSNSNSLRLFLFGSFRLEKAGQTIRLATRKAESLLAYLALHPIEHSRESLAAAFWGDSPDEDARRSLRVALTNLRKQLGDDVFLASRESLGINPASPLWVDALEFKAQAERVLAQNPPDPGTLNLEFYQGPLLNAFFDEWVFPLRDSYQALYSEALLKLIGHARSQSDYQRAIELSQRLLVSDPINELAHQHLMVCFAANGHRFAALKQYDECVRMLREHLAVEPSSETTALYKQLQNAANEAPSLIAAQTNLPVPVTSFVGREKELKQISQRLSQAGSARLLTIVGPGGTGKTRLAIQSARELVDRLSGGVWWVELSALKDAGLVAQAAAIALGLVESSGNSWLKQIITRLNAAPTLLVLDNCEHVLLSCAELVSVLLHECPRLLILATSREPLGINGEITLPLSPFPLPSTQSDPSDFESVRLLLDRGRAVNASFTLTSDNTASVILACRRLDGIPLAIELAAAQLNRLSIQQIVERLDDRFRLLVDGGLTSLPRHQTLQALIDWSHGLLALPERALFRRLAVFSGGWTLEAAIVVAGGYSWEQASEEEMQSASTLAPLTVSPREMVRGLLEHLIEKSLVTVQLHGGERRYTLLENIGLYAREKLIEANELPAIQARHFDYYLQLAKLAQPKLRSAEQLAWLKRLEAEHDNIRVALALAQATGGSAAYHGLQLGAALLWFWHIRSHRTEGFETIKKLLAITTAPPDPSPAWLSMRAHAMHAAGRLTDGDDQLALFEGSVKLFRQAQDMPGLGFALATLAEFHCFRHKIDTATPLLDEALPLLRAADDKFTLAQLHNNALGPMALARGDYEQARALQLEAAKLRNTLGDKDGLAWSIYQLGQIATAQNEWERAQQYYEQTLPLWREVENHSLVQWALNRLGFLALAQKDAVKARQLFGDGLRSALAQGNQVGCALALNGLAGVALEQGQPTEAVRLLGALQVPFSDPEERWDIDDFAAYQRQIAAAKNALPDPEFSIFWKEGQELNVSELAATALASG